MATQNPFALLDGDDNDDPQALLSRVAAEPVKVDASKKAGAKGAKPAPAAAKPAAATTAPARSGYNRGGRGGGRGGYGGRGGDYQTFNEPRDNGRAFIAERQVRGEDGENRTSFDQHHHGDLRRGGGRGGRGRGYGRDGGQRRPHREFDRMSGTGRGGEIKREGAGRGNWGREGEYLGDETVAPASGEAEPKAEGEAAEAAAEVAAPEPPVLSEEELAAQEAARKEKEEEEKQMTLEEYEKVLEEKRKALAASKAAARVVELDEEMAKMTLKKKPEGDDVFVKLGEDKEKAVRKKDEDRPKTVNINEFLKPADGQTFHYRNPRGGRGGGRGGGRYGGGRGGYGGRPADAPALDQSQFPSLA